MKEKLNIDKDTWYIKVDISEPVQSFQSEHSQSDPIDYRLLINKPIWTSNFIFLDFFSSSWATWDWTHRIMDIAWNNGDMQVTYSRTLITWLWSTTYKLTKRYNWVTINGNNITVPAWKICRIQTSYDNSTQFIRLTTTWWSLRYIHWRTLDLDSTNPEVTFINASKSTMTFNIKFATTASDRPIFAINIEII